MKIVNEKLIGLMTEQRKSTANVIKAYGEKLSLEQKQALELALKPVNERLDQLDVISDEDGFNTLIERMMAFDEFIKGAESLTEVLDAIKSLSGGIDELRDRVESLEEKSETQDQKISVIMSDAFALSTKVDENAVKATQGIEDAKSEANEYTDSEIAKLGQTVSEAIDEGGQAVVDLKKRVKANEDAINDTEVDGVTKKGLVSKVSDLESLVEKNAEIAQEKASEAQSNAKNYADSQFLDAAGIDISMANICSDENEMRTILGLPHIACNETEDRDTGGLNG